MSFILGIAMKLQCLQLGMVLLGLTLLGVQDE